MEQTEKEVIYKLFNLNSQLIDNAAPIKDIQNYQTTDQKLKNTIIMLREQLHTVIKQVTANDVPNQKLLEELLIQKQKMVNQIHTVKDSQENDQNEIRSKIALTEQNIAELEKQIAVVSDSINSIHQQSEADQQQYQQFLSTSSAQLQRDLKQVQQSNSTQQNTHSTQIQALNSQLSALQNSISSTKNALQNQQSLNNTQQQQFNTTFSQLQEQLTEARFEATCLEMKPVAKMQKAKTIKFRAELTDAKEAEEVRMKVLFQNEEINDLEKQIQYKRDLINTIREQTSVIEGTCALAKLKLQTKIKEIETLSNPINAQLKEESARQQQLLQSIKRQTHWQNETGPHAQVVQSARSSPCVRVQRVQSARK
ncbi:Hypothetical_protein [Hexamita inflata]|uniref:Hypothetical_protein n=1 Tax=Hexamita inflata TaxID=28002 RepID=A0AA86VSW2_9EUKA|nr:Hypothetical protein HINF_LOCUS64203 [Hexamita inflata]